MFEIKFKVKCGTVREVLQVFGNVDVFVGQQIEDSLWNFVSTTRENVTYRGFACSLVSVQSSRCLPHLVTFTATVRLGIHVQILDITEVTTVEVQVHGVGVGTVGTLDELSHNRGLVFLFLISFYESTRIYSTQYFFQLWELFESDTIKIITIVVLFI